VRGDLFNRNPFRIAIKPILVGAGASGMFFLVSFGLDLISVESGSPFPWYLLFSTMAIGSMAGAAYGLDSRRYYMKDYPLIRTLVCAGLGWIGLWFFNPGVGLESSFGSAWTLGCGALGFLGYRWSRILDRL